MSPFRVALLLVALLSFAPTGAAAEVCFQDGTSGQIYRFPRLKIPKKVGDAVPLHGQVLGAPVTGTLVRVTSEVLDFALLFHANSCNIVGFLDAETLSGNMDLDCGLDGTFEAEHPVSVVSCDADM